MVFSSYIFIAAFLPVVLIVYYMLAHMKNSTLQRLFLIIASLFFYGYYNVKYLVLIVASIGVNYIIARAMYKSVGSRRGIVSKQWLIIGILFNAVLLGYFKYWDFFVENINLVIGSEFGLKHIILPLGISFFTFQQLSFLISVYRGEEETGKFKDYCLFVLFFPQLVAGPIVTYSEMIPQFKDESKRFFNSDNFASGIYMFSIGLFKKAVIADTLSVFVDNGFEMTDIGFAAGWVISLSYTFQIYFDFSGYSDMAIGLGRMFNIDIPINFNAPYRSHSISEFWRRWHITLGRALSTYIYKPLGGSRDSLPRTCVNLFLTFLVSGLWHGAAWTFVIWGAVHGVFAVCERIWGDKLDKVPGFIRTTMTFIIVNVLWVLFRAGNFTEALEVYKGMLSIGNIRMTQLDTVVGYVAYMNFPLIIDLVYIFAILSVLFLVAFRGKSSVTLLANFNTTLRNLMVAAVLFTIALLCLSREGTFIYFNF